MITELASHCIGQAASFHPNTVTCKRCSCKVDCAIKVMKRLEAINEKLDVTDVMRTTQSFLDKHGVRTDSIKEGGKMRFATEINVTFDITVDLSECSTRAASIAKTILKRGIDMKADVKRGDNKFNNVKPTYLESVQACLNTRGGFTHEELRQIIRIDRPSCKETVISNHASFAAQALIAINVVRKNGNYYELAN